MEGIAVSPAVLKVARALIAGGLCPDAGRDDDDRPPYRVREAAELLRVHECTVYRAIQSGDLRAYSVGAAGRAIRIPAEELDAFLARRTIRRLAS